MPTLAYWKVDDTIYDSSTNSSSLIGYGEGLTMNNQLLSVDTSMNIVDAKIYWRYEDFKYFRVFKEQRDYSDPYVNISGGFDISLSDWDEMVDDSILGRLEHRFFPGNVYWVQTNLDSSKNFQANMAEYKAQYDVKETFFTTDLSFVVLAGDSNPPGDVNKSYADVSLIYRMANLTGPDEGWYLKSVADISMTIAEAKVFWGFQDKKTNIWSNEMSGDHIIPTHLIDSSTYNWHSRDIEPKKSYWVEVLADISFDDPVISYDNTVFDGDGI